MQSCIRWAGSKRLTVPQLRSAYPKASRRYVEPFAGSAALFFCIEPQDALLTDLNEELIVTYRAIRADPLRVLECFDRLPKGKRAYYTVRAKVDSTKSEMERAARFLYLNRYSFNGLYRTNSNGHFNVPYGPPKRPLNAFRERVLNASQLLVRAVIKAQDFEVTLGEIQPGDFVYLDPPYAVDEMRIFREYLPGSFSPQDIGRLRDSLAAIDRRGAVFLLSYAMSAEARLLTQGWYTCEIRTRRHVAGFSGARRSAAEVLASNRPLPESLG